MADIDRASPGWPLRRMVFALTATLVVLGVGFALGLIWFQGQRLADQSVDEMLQRSQTAQSDFRNLRFRELELMAQLVADEPYFANLVANATGGGLFGEAQVDIGSIGDQLLELRDRTGFDFGMVLGPEGELLAHTERPVLVAENFRDQPLISQLVDELLPVAGFRQEGSNLFQVAMVPMDKDAALIGFVAVGLFVDDRLVEEIKRVSGTELIWVAGNHPVASTLPTGETQLVLTDLKGSGSLSGARLPSNPARTELELGGERWIAAVTPISADSDTPVVSISLTPLDRILAGYRQTLQILVAGGAGIVILALLLSFALSQRVTRPLTRLATAAEQATRGEFETAFGDISGSAEIGQVARSFDTLLSELREKRDMEEYVADLSRFLPDPSIEGGRGVAEPELETGQGECTLVAMEFRGHGDADGAALISRFQALAQKLGGLAQLCDAQIELFEGQRTMLSFTGDEPLSRALNFLGSAADSLDAAFCAALTQGHVSRATVRSEGRNHRVLAGKPVLQADLLLEESKPGATYLAPMMKPAVEEFLNRYGLVLEVGNGRLSGRKYYTVAQARLSVLDRQTTRRGDELVTTPAHPTRPAAPPPSRSIVPGDVFAGRYEVISILGRGGMGMVYKGYDRELEDFVAIKMLLPEIAKDDAYLGQMKEEIKLARRITHPNVLRTYDFGSAEDIAYISMEYVRGMTLRYLMKQRQRLPFSAGLRIARQLSAGLAAAHDQDIIHRDVKPENLILEATGNAKLMDFGIASPMQRLKGESSGGFVGTPRYAAPEQMEGRFVDARADVYACGVLFYELFTGTSPFSGSAMEIYTAKSEESFPLPDAARDSIPSPLVSIILRCMRQAPEARYANAAELLEALSGVRA